MAPKKRKEEDGCGGDSKRQKKEDEPAKSVSSLARHNMEESLRARELTFRNALDELEWLEALLRRHNLNVPDRPVWKWNLWANKSSTTGSGHGGDGRTMRALDSAEVTRAVSYGGNAPQDHSSAAAAQRHQGDNPERRVAASPVNTARQCHQGNQPGRHVEAWKGEVPHSVRQGQGANPPPAQQQQRQPGPTQRQGQRQAPPPPPVEPCSQRWTLGRCLRAGCSKYHEKLTQEVVDSEPFQALWREGTLPRETTLHLEFLRKDYNLNRIGFFHRCLIQAVGEVYSSRLKEEFAAKKALADEKKREQDAAKAKLKRDAQAAPEGNTVIGSGRRPEEPDFNSRSPATTLEMIGAIPQLWRSLQEMVINDPEWAAQKARAGKRFRDGHGPSREMQIDMRQRVRRIAEVLRNESAEQERARTGKTEEERKKDARAGKKPARGNGDGGAGGRDGRGGSGGSGGLGGSAGGAGGGMAA